MNYPTKNCFPVGKINLIQTGSYFWSTMFLAVLAQQGGIVGGVGQALAIRLPLTEEER